LRPKICKIIISKFQLVPLFGWLYEDIIQLKESYSSLNRFFYPSIASDVESRGTVTKAGLLKIGTFGTTIERVLEEVHTCFSNIEAYLAPEVHTILVFKSKVLQ
jgi:hypothetical protein